MLTSRRSPDQPQTCPFRFTNNILLPPDRKQLFCGFQCVFGPEAALNRLFAHNNARKKVGQPTVGIPFIQLGFCTTDEGTRPCRHHRCLA
jgi:hypothetical protein